MLFGLSRVRDWFIKGKLRQAAAVDQASLLARVTYELRTSLNGIVGYAEFLENRSLEPMMNFMAKIIREQGSHLARSFNAYLDLQYLLSGQVRLSNKHFNLALLLQDLVALHQPLALARSISLQLICSPDALLVSIDADATRMRQALDALIVHAIQTAQAWDVIPIRLSFAELEDCLTLSIASTPLKSEPKNLQLEVQFWTTDTYQFQLQGGPGVEMALAKSLLRLTGCSVGYSVSQGNAGTLNLRVPVNLS